MIFHIALACSVLLPCAAFAYDVRRMRAPQLVLSHFWYFTFVFLAAFPLRAWLLQTGTIRAQIGEFMDGSFFLGPLVPDIFLANALLVATIFWCATYFGYRSVNLPGAPYEGSKKAEPLNISHQAIAGYCLILVAAVGALIYLDPNTDMLRVETQIVVRKGSGLVWILPEIFVYAVIILVGIIVTRGKGTTPPFVFALLLLGLVASFWISIELQTRRVLAAVILTSIVAVVICRHRYWPVALLGVTGTVFASPAFELLRVIPQAIYRGQSMGGAILALFDGVLGFDYMKLLSIGFQGVEHLARLIARASWTQLLTGFDYGISWLFNMGLALFPRVIWEGKPVVYGGFSQFQWLYPNTFFDGQATLAIPASVVVDFSFGFGIPAGLILAFFLGRFLAVCQRWLWDHAGNTAGLAISLYTYVFIFNIVRGGTIHGLSLILMAAICVIMLGPRETMRGFMTVIQETVGYGNHGLTNRAASDGKNEDKS